MPIRNGVRRSLLPMAAVVVVLMLLTGLVSTALAQSQGEGASTGTPLSVADFDQSGLETAVLASFDAGGDCCWSTIRSVVKCSAKMSIHEGCDIETARISETPSA